MLNFDTHTTCLKLELYNYSEMKTLTYFRYRMGHLKEEVL